MKKYLFKSLVVILMLSFIITGCIKEKVMNKTENKVVTSKLDEKGTYYELKDVALYLHTYGKLPSNYLTKNEAKKLGWNPKAGNLWEVTNRGVIGGDKFGNREKKLPIEETYYEADVNYNGGHRGKDRLVYTTNGKVIYYTGDHYNSFELLYDNK